MKIGVLWDPFGLGPEVFHSEIAEFYCFSVIVILQADMAGQTAGGGICPRRHHAVVDADGIVVAAAHHF